jgi:hypothetical protein
MDPYRGGEMTISVFEVAGPPALCLTWKGRGDEREPRKTLQPFLHGVLDRAAAARTPVELHVQQMTFVNSGTIGCIVDLIHRCEAASVPITVRYDKASGWQRLSFEALRVMIKTATRLHVEAA